MAKGGAVLVIRCTPEEAHAVRQAAQREHRTISAYVLHSVLSRLAYKGQLQHRHDQAGQRSVP